MRSEAMTEPTTLEARALALVRRLAGRSDADIGQLGLLDTECIRGIAREAEAGEKKWRVRHIEWWRDDDTAASQPVTRDEAELSLKKFPPTESEYFEIVTAGAPLIPVAQECGVESGQGHGCCVRVRGHDGRHVSFFANLTKE
jgi:hypothetical protein